MRASEFWSVMDEVFGSAYARSIAADLVLAQLDGRTPQQALDDGEPPRRVWAALCDATGQPESVRWLHREAPGPRRPRRPTRP